MCVTVLVCSECVRDTVKTGCSNVVARGLGGGGVEMSYFTPYRILTCTFFAWCVFFVVVRRFSMRCRHSCVSTKSSAPACRTQRSRHSYAKILWSTSCSLTVKVDRQRIYQRPALLAHAHRLTPMLANMGRGVI